MVVARLCKRWVCLYKAVLETMVIEGGLVMLLYLFLGGRMVHVNSLFFLVMKKGSCDCFEGIGVTRLSSSLFAVPFLHMLFAVNHLK